MPKIVLLCLLLYSSVAWGNCKVVSQHQWNGQQQIYLIAGLQEVTLACQSELTNVVYFPLDGLTKTQAIRDNGHNLLPLQSARLAYLLPAGNYTATITLVGLPGVTVDLKVKPLDDFYAQSTTHTLTISAFIGFCFALAIYVGILGRSIRNAGFYYYSVYIFCAGFFFLLQEGLLNIVLSANSIFNHVSVKLLFAGLTVYTAQLFIAKLLDFSSLLKPWENKLLDRAALSVFIISVITFITPASLLLTVNKVMGLITVFVIVGIISATVYAVLRKIHAAKLVLTALIAMLSAMLYRVLFGEWNPFLERYALIIAVTLEAMLLALAASEKVKRLEKEKLLAFNRASQDDLCPVLNRRGWENAANQLLKNHRKEGGFLALLFIDVDKFKQINDKFGHGVGDRVLIILAKILRNQSRAQDIIGRMGGDEFVIMSHCHSQSQAQRLIDRINARLTDLNLTIENHTINLQASVGQQIISVPHTDLSILLHQTDMLMYAQKT